MGLYEKMYNVMCDNESLEKKMQVGKATSSYSYKAISESEVLNMIKPLLKKYKLILFPINVDVQEIEASKMTQLKARYKIVDVKTGEFEILETVGNGADSQDKGSGKAYTLSEIFEYMIERSDRKYIEESFDEYIYSLDQKEIEELYAEKSTDYNERTK